MLLYEAGEGLRYDEISVRAGVSGFLRVLRKLDMLPAKGLPKRAAEPVVVNGSAWIRAPASGLLRLYREVGEHVEEGQKLAVVASPFGTQEEEIAAPAGGVLIGRATMPVVNEGDAVYHLADVPVDDTEDRLSQLTADLNSDPMFDEDEIL